jgi:hypothetical protein
MSQDEIAHELRKHITPPDWKINLQKAVQREFLEGRVYKEKFRMGRGAYGLTWGRTSLLPVLIAKVNPSESGRGSIIKIRIRPSVSGLVIISIFSLVAISGLVISLQESKPQGAVVSTIFLALTVFFLMGRFGKEVRFFEEFISVHLRASRN